MKKLADEFSSNGCAALLPGFLAPQILAPLMEWVEASQFVLTDEVSRDGVFGTTLFVPQFERSIFLLHFALNRPALFKFSEQVADCTGIANFRGRIHRTLAGTGQHIDWHDDAVEARTLGLCINLSAERYSGGTLQIRDPKCVIRAEISQGDPGDAFLFRIDRGWEHRLNPVSSGHRTVGGADGFGPGPTGASRNAFTLARSLQMLKYREDHPKSTHGIKAGS